MTLIHVVYLTRNMFSVPSISRSTLCFPFRSNDCKHSERLYTNQIRTFQCTGIQINGGGDGGWNMLAATSVCSSLLFALWVHDTDTCYFFCFFFHSFFLLFLSLSLPFWNESLDFIWSFLHILSLIRAPVHGNFHLFICDFHARYLSVDRGLSIIMEKYMKLWGCFHFVCVFFFFFYIFRFSSFSILAPFVDVVSRYYYYYRLYSVWVCYLFIQMNHSHFFVCHLFFYRQSSKSNNILSTISRKRMNGAQSRQCSINYF